MKLIFKEKNIAISLICLSLTLLIDIWLIFISTSSYEPWLHQLFLALVLAFFVDTFLLKNVHFKLFSIAYFFVAFSFIFHFGQLFVHVLTTNYQYVSSNHLLIYPPSINMIALMLSLNVIQIIVTIMILYGNNKTMYTCSKDYFLLTNRQIEVISWIILIITIPMKTNYTIASFAQFGNSGYSSIIKGYSGVFIQISNFAILGFTLLLLSKRNNRNKQRFILVMEILYMIWTMLSGGRFYALISIILLTYIFIKTGKKLNTKKYVSICLFTILLLQFISAITIARTQQNFGLETILAVASSVQSNLALRILDEFGSTVYTVIISIAEIPLKLNYHYGGSYLKAWLLCGLNVGGILDGVKDTIEYPLLFSRRYSFGGTYIGELYYNFGYLCLIVAPLLGLLVVKISKKFDDALENYDIMKITILIMPVYGLLGWVRGYFDGMTRSFVWGYFFVAIIGKFASLFCNNSHVKRKWHK